MKTKLIIGLCLVASTAFGQGQADMKYETKTHTVVAPQASAFALYDYDFTGRTIGGLSIGPALIADQDEVTEPASTDFMLGLDPVLGSLYKTTNANWAAQLVISNILDPVSGFGATYNTGQLTGNTQINIPDAGPTGSTSVRPLVPVGGFVVDGLATDGTLHTVAAGGGGGTPGGSNTQVQFNNAGAFGGISTLTTTGTVTTQSVGNNYRLADSSDATKKVGFNASNITTATTRTVVIPDADSVTVVPASATANQFLTNIPSGGTQTKAQPALTDLASGTSAQLASVLSDETGSGAAVFGTNPTLSAFELGSTDTSITRGTAGHPAAEGVAMILASDTVNALSSSTSANLRTLLSDENGTGAAIFSGATSPAFTTPDFTTGFTIGAAATSRKIPVGNGTNYVASTETWAVPGTIGNVLTSDGTNWTSATPTTGLGYCLMGETAVSLAPADSTTYYFGFGAGIAIAQKATYANGSLTIPKAGTIKRITWKIFVVTNGTNEAVAQSLRLNDTTDTSLGASETWDPGANTQKTFTYTGLSIAVALGDTIALKIVTPAWATNPTISSSHLIVYIE